MELAWKYLLYILWLSYLLVSSMLLFMRGFLLNKTILDFKSSCGFIVDKCDYHSHPPITGKQDIGLNCIHSASLERLIASEKYEQMCVRSNVKVVLILIDALRSDFATFVNGNNTNLFHHNKLPVIQHLMKHSNAHMYKFIADPPTTTMQRINGLMTGSLPTFVDIGSNFASSVISEDNLIDQMVNHNKTVVFMGDDTWMNIFPGRFLRSFPYPSFNVWDLDTVDNGIRKNLMPELKKNDWNLLIAHFLGVDHCGHRFGPNHPEMARKLMEMNEVIKNVVKTMSNDTVLIVIGDHGMTDTGDHGGASDKETLSALFVYSPSNKFLSGFKVTDEVRQIDLTPTLAALLGIPIPFSNLGKIILDAVPSLEESPDLHMNWEYAVSLLWSNLMQIAYYIQEYSKTNTQFSPFVLSNFLNEFQSLKMKAEDMKGASDVGDLLNETKVYMNSIRLMCENVWVQFDSFSMSRGLVLMFLTLSLTFILIDGMPHKFCQEVIRSHFLHYGFLGLLSVAIVTYILNFLGIIDSFELSLYFATNTLSVTLFSILVCFNWHHISSNWHLVSRMKDSLDVISRFIGVTICFTMFSNSYTVEECCVSSFFLTTMVWISVRKIKVEPKRAVEKSSECSLSSFLSSIRGKVILLTITFSALIRFSWYFWQCREEQHRQCYIDKGLSKSSACVMTVLSFAVFVTIARAILRSFGNLIGFSPTIFTSRYSPTVCVVCCGCYWVLHSLPSEAQSKLILPWQLLILPQIVLFTSVLSILLFYVQPLSVFYVSKKMDISRLPIENLIPALFHHLRDVMIQKTGTELKSYPVVYGLATVYSAAFFNIAIFMGLLSAILLGESRALVVIILLLSLTLLAIILGTIRYSRSNGPGDLFSVPWWAVLCWGLSSVYFFYGTGHQPTFPTIQWDAAFLLGDIVSNLVPGLLVIMNTFISHILHALLLPVLYITPFTLSVTWPKLVPMNDGKKGELFLFEQDSVLRKGMFLLAVRYILFHALRVFVAMFAACIHSRHLMAWKIFAPKLIFESVGFLVTLPFVLLGIVFVERVSKGIDNLIKKIESDNT